MAQTAKSALPTILQNDVLRKRPHAGDEDDVDEPTQREIAHAAKLRRQKQYNTPADARRRKFGNEVVKPKIVKEVQDLRTLGYTKRAVQVLLTSAIEVVFPEKQETLNAKVLKSSHGNLMLLAEVWKTLSAESRTELFNRSQADIERGANGQCMVRDVTRQRLQWPSRELPKLNKKFGQNEYQDSIGATLVVLLWNESFPQSAADEEVEHLCHDKYCYRFEHLAYQTSSNNKSRSKCQGQGRCVCKQAKRCFPWLNDDDNDEGENDAAVLSNQNTQEPIDLTSSLSQEI